MAGKKVRSEIETMRGELRGLSEAVWALRDQVTFEAATAAATLSRPSPSTAGR